MLKIGLAGAWHVHFDQYASEFSEREDCKITVLWDNDIERGKAAAEKYNCEFERDYDKFIAREDVDGIVINTETSLHTDIMLKAAKAKKHIFTEKVLTFNMKEANAVRDAVNESGIKFCISFPWRCRPEYLYAKKAVNSGMLGTVTYARVRNAHDGSSSGWLPEYFYDKSLCGGGAMMDLGAHPMYLLLNLFGNPTAVTSTFTSVCGKGVEDNAVSIIEFSNIIASSETGFASKNCPFTLEITGTNGTLIWGGNLGKLAVNTGEGFIEPELGEELKRPVDQWADGILKGTEISFTIDDAVELTNIMEKAYKSNSEHKRIILNTN